MENQNELGRKGMEGRGGKKQYFPLLFSLRSKDVNQQKIIVLTD
ncbi:hypothetical protein EW15_2040 [Prochlorococcus sp. MIT 0801]|nr:hypothetical protein EW15_2040 [Prochlorococcus sp. MIT 0801]